MCFRLRLADGTPFTQIASDGGLLERPVQRAELLMPGGERVEVVVDFSRYAVGQSVVLENTGALPTERPEVLRFDIDAEAPTTARSRRGSPRCRRCRGARWNGTSSCARSPR
ncbi:hypothetical protein ACFZCL_34600 [Streptomyces sp. NPDC008159]|uniref:hypothetical protein n=1 Tax=Streptomyces sp. NPDC008159 TaxID=3364817 RepID=UPI0036EF5090